MHGVVLLALPHYHVAYGQLTFRNLLFMLLLLLAA
jgi:hypothetical protein